MKKSLIGIIRFGVLFFVLTLLAGASCKNTVKSGYDNQSSSANISSMVVAFYNVENLFDVVDDPATMDEDFTPAGKLHWDDVRYRTKLGHIPEVLNALPGELPAFIGLCEVENRSVLEDLIKNPLFQGRYMVVHQDSPDERGIDVAALVDTTRINQISFQYSKVILPSEKDPNTRDILHVLGKSADEPLHFFVNHWPSRGGGQQETEINRITAADVLEKEIRKVIDQDAKAKILVMGDFNDYPTDISISEHLKAGIDKGGLLFNYMYDDCLAKKGSHYYKGEWGALDQFMASWELKNATSGWNAKDDAAQIFMDELILFTDKEGNKRPNRTYIGDRYNEGGYSDHLPIYVVVSMH